MCWWIHGRASGATSRRADAEPGAEPEEVELKLTVLDAGAIRALILAMQPPLPGARWLEAARTIELQDRYVDTRQAGLRAAGLVARIRTGAGAPRLTVKSIARRGAGAVHRRLELEGDAGSGDGDDPREWPVNAARARILAVTGADPLVPLVTIRQRRLQRDLATDESVIELSLDDVEVAAAGGGIEAWVELEAELRAGSDDDLAALGRLLLRRPDLAPSKSSKLDRAMAAIGAA